MTRTVEVAASLWGSRSAPPAALAAHIKAIESSGAKSVMLADHMTGFIPPQLWTPENTPMASVVIGY